VMRRADAALELDHGIRRSAASVPADAADRSSVAALRTTPSDVAEPDRADRWRPPAAATTTAEPERAFVLDANALSKTYRRGDEVVHALDDVSVTLRAGELVGLVGRSGSGKTTLLNVIAGWEHADAGTMELSGAPSATPGWDELAVVPQKLGLFDELSVRENLEYPARLHGRLEELRDRVDDLMEDLGIAHLAARYPKETSLGEQQRTAVARALVLSPTLVLADEPTGHQDAASERRVLEAFGRAAAEGGSCLIATHNVSLAPRLDRVLEMADGRLAHAAAPS
jgi:ABC-type lipoprotein export system ATPase subunit